MAEAFNSFDRSPLGAFIRSPLGVRNDEAEGQLVILGTFFVADGNLSRNTARLDELTPELISVDGVGLDDDVYSGVVHDENLYVTGNFQDNGDNTIQIRQHAKFNVDLHRWEEAPGGGVQFGLVWDTCLLGSDMAIVGDFPDAGGVANTDSVAKYNGTSYSAFPVPPSSFNLTVQTCVEFKGELHVGGQFSTPFDGGAKLSGGAWVDIDPGAGRRFGRDVLEMAIYNEQLVIAGDFVTVGSAPNRGRRIVLWDGTSYDTMDDGAEDTVDALVVFEGDLIIGGVFADVGSAPLTANRVARWNGTSWSAMGSGLGGGTGRVEGLHVHKGVLYAIGSFSQNGIGTSMTNIAKWNTGTNEFEPVTPGTGLSSFGLSMLSYSGFLQ